MAALHGLEVGGGQSEGLGLQGRTDGDVRRGLDGQGRGGLGVVHVLQHAEKRDFGHESSGSFTVISLLGF